MKMIDERKQKIRDLKLEITSTRERMQEHLANVDVAAEKELSEEEQKANKEKRMEEFQVMRANEQTLKETLKKTRLNKYGSAFFEFTPNTGMNRRQARRFKKQNRQTRRK